MPPRSPLIWAYTYRLVPPQPAEKLRAVRALLAHEHRAAARRAAIWEGRLVVDERIAHILVLSDSPNLDHEVNQRLEDALRAIDAGFAVTVPLAVPGAVHGHTRTNAKKVAKPVAKPVAKKTANTPPRLVARKK
jgi:hypothetical protein